MTVLEHQMIIDQFLEGIGLKESARLSGLSLLTVASVRQAFIKENPALLESLVGVSSLVSDLLVSQRHIEELDNQINLEDDLSTKANLMKRRAELLQIKQSLLKNPILAAPIKQTQALSEEDHKAILDEASPAELERIQEGDSATVQEILKRIKERGREKEKVAN